MRQSLIVGARPRFSANHEFPKVPLNVGVWKILPENRVDTKLEATVFKLVPGPEGGMFEVPSVHMISLDPNEVLLVAGPAQIQMRIVEGGSEAYINVVAVRHDRPD